MTKATSPLKHPKIPRYAQPICLTTEIFNINPQALIQIQTFAFFLSFKAKQCKTNQTCAIRPTTNTSYVHFIIKTRLQNEPTIKTQ